MHVSAFNASSVQLGTHSHMWLHCIYTRELALTKHTRTVQHNTTSREVGFALWLLDTYSALQECSTTPK